MSMVLMKPVAGPKAWRGEQLAADSAWIVNLTAEALADIDRALATTKSTGLPLAEITREHFPLPVMSRHLAEILDEIYAGRGLVVLHSRTEFVDGAEPHEQRHMLRLWLKFPAPWPVGGGFPEHVGYQLVSGSPALVEA